MYDRSHSSQYREIDRWSDGVGWLAHPDETGQRASHAVRDDDGDVWLVDPLDAPGVDDLVESLAGVDAMAGGGPVSSDAASAVAGVVVLSDYHTRDAAVFAERYDVPVFVPQWADRVAARVDAPVTRVSDRIAGFEITHVRPLHAWNEALAYRERDHTLYVPDALSTATKFTVGSERIGLPTVQRLFPPRERYGEYRPERIVFGHGVGVLEDASEALEETMDGARRRLPRAVVTNLPSEVRAVVGALR